MTDNKSDENEKKYDSRIDCKQEGKKSPFISKGESSIIPKRVFSSYRKERSNHIKMRIPSHIETSAAHSETIVSAWFNLKEI